MRSILTHFLFWGILCIARIGFSAETEQLSANNEILFIENKGQIVNQSGRPANDVLYIMRAPSLTVFIYRDGLSYQFTEITNTGKVKKANSQIDEEEIILHPAIKTHRVDVRFKNALINAVVSADEQSAYYENYFTALNPDGIKNIHAFKKITVQNIYPGIDWIIYSKEGKLKYDFVVQPGADPSQIQMSINNADQLDANSNELIIQTKLGSVTDSKLYCYEKETGDVVNASFNLKGKTVSFITSAFNSNHTLVIDPELLWSTYYGGENEDAINSMAKSDDGFIYITGYTHSGLAMAGSGFDNSYNGGAYDMWCAKLDTSGNRIWGTFYGGTAGDYGTGVAVDGNDNVLISGFTYSNNFPTTPGAFQTTFGGFYDAFLVKFASDGSLVWATLFGKNNADYGRAVTTDPSGNIYLAGSAESSGLSHFGYQNTIGGMADQLLVKFAPNGQRLWATYYGGEKNDYARGVTVDINNNIYMTGYTESTTGIYVNGFDSTQAGKNDCSLVKYAPDGNLLWSTYYGGTADENSNGVATDENANVYIAAQTGTTNGLGFNGYDNSGNGGPDALIVKFDKNGNLKWASYYGGLYEDMGKAITVTDKFVYMSGHSYSTYGIAKYGYQNNLTGYSDAIITKWDTTGNFIWASYAGGYDIEYGRAVVAFSPYLVFLSGKTFSYTFPTTPGAYQETFGGNPSDGFIQKIADCPNPSLYYFDYDNDGYGNYFWPILSCHPVPGYVDNLGDCNDFFNWINPTATEICNGFDDNCNGLTDDDDPEVTDQPLWYADADGDSYGNIAVTTAACASPPGYVNISHDCDDGNMEIHPGATELCNAIDDDCDFIIDEDIIFTTYYADADADGYGNNLSTTTTCAGTPPGYTINSTDCNDANTAVHPSALEICNSIDDDCNILIDENVIISSISPSGPTSFCKGAALLTLTANDGVGFIYQWKRNGGNIAGATGETFNVTKTGNYTVLITIPGGCSDLSDVLNCNVYSKPNPSITALGSLDICAAGSVKLKTAFKPGDTYQWYKNGAIITGATSNTYMATSIGTYYIKEINVNGCTKNSAPVVVTTSCREGKDFSEIGLQIYPNPVKNNLFIQLNTNSDQNKSAVINIYNSIGEIIYSEDFEMTNGILTEEIILPVAISNGMYLIQIATTEEFYSQQIVIAR